MQKLILAFIFSIMAPAAAFADKLLLGDGKTETSLEQSLSSVQSGDIVVLGEIHGSAAVAAKQMQVLKTLRKNGLSVSVGLEFLEYPDQAVVDQYREGKMQEADFLKAILWGALPFSAYREQILFPNACGLFTVALNIPRGITAQIAKSGLTSLSEDQKFFLPDNLTLGNANYFARFKEVMGSHVPDAKIQDYFAAQSVWDETMAWRATRFQEMHPDQVLVIIVGEFHVQYGGGLPDRLRARGLSPVHTFSFVSTEGLSDAERDLELLPSQNYGPRADFIWEVQIP